MKNKFTIVICFITMLSFTCAACGNSKQSSQDMNRVAETTIKQEVETESTVPAETETYSANSAVYSVDQGHFLEKGPVEYQDYFYPDLKMSINLSNGNVSHKMDEAETYFCQSEYFKERYQSLKGWIESQGQSEDDIYCLYTDVELTNMTNNDIIYSIANWTVYQIVKTDSGEACMFLSLTPSYDYVGASDVSMKYYEMPMKAGETKQFRIAFVIDKQEYFNTTGKYFDELDTDNIYLNFTGDTPIISDVNGPYAPNDSEDLKLLKVPIGEK